MGWEPLWSFPNWKVQKYVMADEDRFQRFLFDELYCLQRLDCGISWFGHRNTTSLKTAWGRSSDERKRRLNAETARNVRITKALNEVLEVSWNYLKLTWLRRFLFQAAAELAARIAAGEVSEPREEPSICWDLCFCHTVAELKQRWFVELTWNNLNSRSLKKSQAKALKRWNMLKQIMLMFPGMHRKVPNVFPVVCSHLAIQQSSHNSSSWLPGFWKDTFGQSLPGGKCFWFVELTAVLSFLLFFPECVARVPVSLGGLGVRLCSPSFAFAVATVRNRSQPLAVVP